MNTTITPPARWCAPTPSAAIRSVGNAALTPLPVFSPPTTTNRRVDLQRLEGVLREAIGNFGYHLPCRQTAQLDRLTAFVRAERRWWALESHLVEQADLPEYRKILAYARARWVNTWTAVGIEQVFTDHPRVTPYPTRTDRLVDFEVDGVALDLKITVFPASYGGDWTLTQRNPDHLIKWLYGRQSRGSRYHTANRLFIVLHHFSGQHWRLKAELGLIRAAVEKWLSAPRLRRVYLAGIGVVESNIIFVEQ